MAAATHQILIPSKPMTPASLARTRNIDACLQYSSLLEQATRSAGLMDPERIFQVQWNELNIENAPQVHRKNLTQQVRHPSIDPIEVLRSHASDTGLPLEPDLLPRSYQAYATAFQNAMKDVENYPPGPHRTALLVLANSGLQLSAQACHDSAVHNMSQHDYPPAETVRNLIHVTYASDRLPRSPSEEQRHLRHFLTHQLSSDPEQASVDIIPNSPSRGSTTIKINHTNQQTIHHVMATRRQTTRWFTNFINQALGCRTAAEPARLTD